MKSILWYAKEVGLLAGAAALAFFPEILGNVGIPEYTMVGKALPFIRIAWSVGNIKRKYMNDTLPSGLDKIMNKIPDKFTGIKQSKGEENVSK